MADRKLLVVQCAALGYNFLNDENGAAWNGLEFKPAESVFPAVTCTVQASFRTASPPSAHGMVANGFYHRDLSRPMFWEQSSALVSGPRIWEDFRRRGKRVAMLFWQQSLGEDVDVALSPAPIHKHHGGMIPDCYGKPDGLYARLCDAVGEEFSLADYWGPVASSASGNWIASAAAALMADAELACDLCFVYLPTLDFDLQRFGPEDRNSEKALVALLAQLKRLTDAASAGGYDVLIFGDYAMAGVTEAVFPNRALLEAGLMKTRKIGHMLYPDFYQSLAFAVADHEIAHVHVKDRADLDAVCKCLIATEGVAEVYDRAMQKSFALDHPRSGEFVVVAKPGSWFAYPWWTSSGEAPEYSTHVDIHNKPGYDPCELFFGTFPTQVSTDTSRILGSHGRAGGDRSACWASNCKFAAEPKTLIELSAAVRDWLKE